MRYILALDQGTTSSRAILFDHAGAIKAVAQKEFQQFFPQPGWVEHDPMEIWSTQIGTAIEVLHRAGATAGDLAGIGITNQRETTVVWDRQSGAPVGRSIVWQDRRTAQAIDRLRAEGKAGLVTRKTGLVPDAYFSASKVAWILENIPEARKKAEAGKLAFGTIDSWLIFQLTAGKLHLTDVTNASRTMLFDIHKLDWDDELLQLWDIPRSMLPEVRSSSEVYGEVGPGVAGLAGVKIGGIAGDQQAALFGQLCLQDGMAKNTYGTGCFMLMNTGTKAVTSNNNLLTTVAWKIGSEVHYALEGSVFIGGAVTQWLRDGLKIIRSSGEIEALAGSVADNGGVYIVPAFAGLGAPHWDAYARGTICGLTRGSTSAHIARAALESIAFQVADLADCMVADCGLRVGQLRVDGGAAVNNLLMQFQADLLQTSIVRPRIFETTALGAAYLAGLATGFWKSPADVSAQWQVDREFQPSKSADEVAALRSTWSEAISRARNWAKPK
jgi:glycerol kinase